MSEKNESMAETDKPSDPEGQAKDKTKAKELPKELGGRKGPEPTRYGDWEKNGIISDF